MKHRFLKEPLALALLRLWKDWKIDSLVAEFQNPTKNERMKASQFRAVSTGFLVCFSLLLASSLRASHLLTAAFNCEIIRDTSLNNPIQLQIELILLSDDAALTPGNSATIRMRGPNGNEQYITLNRQISKQPFSGYKDCYLITNGPNEVMTANHYSGSVPLTRAGFYNLAYADCCPYAVDNVDNMNSLDIYAAMSIQLPQAFMNGTMTGSLRSPYIGPEHLYAQICTSSSGFVFPSIEVNAPDSLYVNRAAVRDLNSDWFTYGTATYSAGFSAIQPMGSVGQAQLTKSNGIEFNSLSLPKRIALAYTNQLYKSDPNNPASKFLLSEAYYVRFVSGIDNCVRDSSLDSARLSDLLINGLPSQMCHSTSISTWIPPVLNSNTIAADGSDFQILDSAGNSIAIQSIQVSNGILHLQHAGFQYNGQFRLISQVGSDSNSIGTKCAGYLITPDTLSFSVHGCQSSGVELKENELLGISIYPNPLSGSQLHCELPVPATLQLFDLHGRLVFQTDCDGGRSELQLPQLETGLYILRLVTDGAAQELKLQISSF